jgi:hypothetical protein
MIVASRKLLKAVHVSFRGFTMVNKTMVARLLCLAQ